jgi:hypothetical protein
MAGAFLFAITTAVAMSHHGNSTKNKQNLNSQTTPQTNNTTDTKSHISGEATHSGTDPPSTQNTTHVNVNGQDIPVPTQGTTSRTINTDNGQTSVNISNSSSSTQSSAGGASSSDSLNVNVNSSSTSNSSSN